MTSGGTLKCYMTGIMRVLAGLAGVIFSMVLGCATNQSFDTTETPQERAEIERLESAKRDRLGRPDKINRSPAAVAEKSSGN